MKEKITELRIKIDGLSQLVKELKPNQQFRLNINAIPDSLTAGEYIRIFRESGWALEDAPKGIEPIPQVYKELEKSYDSLILAKAWLGKVLGELGEDTPYKNDGDRKTVEDIEETADKKKWKHFLEFNGDWDNMSHIEKVDWIREEIKEVITIIDKDMPTVMLDFIQLKTISDYFKYTYKYLFEARFWLGFELQRIKENEK